MDRVMDFFHRLAYHNATLSAGELDFAVEAPHGSIWQSNARHEIVAQFCSNEGANMAVSGIEDAMQRMESGLVDCTDPACERCKRGGTIVNKCRDCGLAIGKNHEVCESCAAKDR